MRTSRTQKCSITRVLTTSDAATRGTLYAHGLCIPVALGRSGIKARKREGDGATPRGRFGVLWVYYRPDRMPRPKTALACKPIRPHDGWCDASEDRSYNRPVAL